MKSIYKIVLSVIVSIVFLLIASQTAKAATVTWDGSTSIDWADGTNWDLGSAPLSTDEVVIPDTAGTPNDPTVSSGAVCNNLTIESGGILNGGSDTLTVSGNWSNSGTFTCGTGTVTFNGTTDQTLSGTLSDATGKFFNLTMNNAGASGNDDVILGANTDITGDLTLTDGDLNLGIYTTTLDGDLSFASAAALHRDTSTFVFNGIGKTISGTETTLELYNVTVNTGKSVTDNIATTVYGTTFTVNGTFTVGDGKTVSFFNSNQTLAIGDGGLIQGVDVADSIFQLTNDYTPTITLTGTGNFGSDLYLQFYFPSIGSYTLPSLNYKAGMVELYAVIYAACTVTPEAGTLDIDGNLRLYAYQASTLNFSNSNNTAINIGGSFTCVLYSYGAARYTKGTTDTITFNGATGTQNFTPRSDSTFNNITHSGASTLQLNANLTVGGTFNNSNGIFNANAKTVTVTGLATLSGGTYQASTAKQTFNGGLTLSGGTLTASSGEVEVNGTLTISSGTLTGSTGELDINGDVALSGTGILTAPSGTFGVTGNWDNNGTFTSGTNTVTFDGGSKQTLTSGGAGDNNDFNNLIHSGAGELELAASNALDVDGILTQSGAGDFDTGANAVTAGALTVSGGTFSNDARAGTWDINGAVTISSGTLTATSGTFTISGNWDNSATFTHNSATLTLDGATSATFDAGASSYNNIGINKTSGVDANDNVTFQTDSVTITGTLTIADGELIQQVALATGTVTLSHATSEWTNVTNNANVTLSGAVANVGTITFNAPTSDLIQILSSASPTQRNWQGAGTFSMTDVDVEDQTCIGGSPATITVTDGTNSDNNINWLFGDSDTVSGVVYQNNRTTNVGAGVTVGMYIYYTGGSTATDTTTTGAVGDFSFTNLSLSAGDMVTLYIDDDGSYEGTTVIESNGGDALNVNLSDTYVNLISQNDNISNTELGNADSGDGDIHYEPIVGGNLTVESTYHLYITTGGTFTPAGDVTIDTADCQIVGTLTLGADTLEITTSGTLDIDGTLNLDNNASAIDLVGALDLDGTLDASGFSPSINVAGSVDFSGGTFTAGSSTIIFDGTTTLTSDSETLNNVQIGTGATGGSLTLADQADINGNLTVQTGGATTLDLTNRTLLFGGATFDLTNLDTFTITGSTVNFDSSTAGQTVTSSTTDTYNTITVSNSHADGVTFEDDFTTATLNDTTPSSKITFNAGDTYIITGAAGLNLTGGAGAEITLISDSSPTKFIFDVQGGDQTVSWVNVKDSEAISKNITANNSINSGGNDNGDPTPHWIFPAVTRYWLGTTSADWNNSLNWSSTSGGAPGANPPSTGDTAVFDAGGNNPCTINIVTVSLDVLDIQAGYTSKFDANGNDITTTGNVTVAAGATGELELDAGSQLTIGGTLTVSGGTLDGLNGTIDANGSVSITGGELIAPIGDFNVATNWSHAGGTFTHSNGTVIFDTAADSTIVNNTIFYNLSCIIPSKTIKVTAGTTQTINNTLTIDGQDSATKITLHSTTDGAPYTLNFPNGAQAIIYVDLRDCTAGTSASIAYNSIDSTGNTNWTFLYVDPYGIVFDSASNNPIQGAVVTIFTSPGGVQCTPGTEIALTDSNPQTTGADGAYSYDCINGDYYITITADGYTYPSTKTTFPAGRVIVNGSKGEVFTVAGVVIEMDHPLDSDNQLLKIKKDVNKKEVVIGEVVTYTVTIKNETASDVTNVYLEDMIPAGFKYINDRAILDNKQISDPTGNRPITFNIGTVSSGQTRILKYQLVVGSGVTTGNYKNSAVCKYSDGTIISNKDSETVKVTLDPLFDLGTIIGKVFWDRNEDRIQKTEDRRHLPASQQAGKTENGIANVQIVMEDGTIVTTDADGKYHVPAIIPGRHVLRINERTLPKGAYLTTDKAVIVDITPGILAKVNFGVNSKSRKQKTPAKKTAGGEDRSQKTVNRKQKREKENEIGVQQSPVIASSEIPSSVIASPDSVYRGVAISKDEIASSSAKGETPRNDTQVETKIHSQHTKTDAEASNIQHSASNEQDGVQPLTSNNDYLFFIAMGDAKAGYNFNKGDMESVEDSDRFQDGFWSEGKFAYYLKGKIKGKYLITSSLDTQREQKELFRNLDPDKYYPVYGDASTINYDATNTQGRLYLLIEWDKSKVLWGNYVTGMTDTEFAQFNRTLYGGKIHFESVSSTKFAEPVTKLIIFDARVKQRAAHNEFVGTGGSLFYLKHSNIIEGSEKIKIEIRDKITGIVLTTKQMQSGFDYEIDYSNGRVIFGQSVSSIAESNSIISSQLLDGNSVYVVVDYEYETKDNYDKGTQGMRLQQSLTDYLTVGGTYVKEKQQDKDYELKGLDVTIHLGENITVTAEQAESKSGQAGSFISTDGGLSFTELTNLDSDKGKAYGIKTEAYLFDKLGLTNYYKKIEEGFSSTSTISQQGKELFGAGLTWDINPKTKLALSHDVQKLIDDGNPQTQLQVGAEETKTTSAQITHQMEKLRLTGEYRHQDVTDKDDEFESETNRDEDTVAAKADYKLTEKVGISLEQQTTLRGETNNQTSVGISARPNERLFFKAKQTAGTEGSATSIGTTVNINDKISAHTTLAVANSMGKGQTQSVVVGSQQKVNEGLVITTEKTYAKNRDTLIEGNTLGLTKEKDNRKLKGTFTQQKTQNSNQFANTNIFGLSGDINDKLAMMGSFERGVVQNHNGTQATRSAGALGVSYADKNPETDNIRLQASSKLELRTDDGEEDKKQYLIYSALEWQSTINTTLFAKINISQTENTSNDSTEAQYKELVTGVAYRPIYFDRLNLLARYTYLEDTLPSDQTDFSDIEEERVHTLSGELAYDLTNKLQLVEKLAYKFGEEKVAGFDFTKTQTWLNIHRLNYNINNNWQFGAEYRFLTQKEAEDSKQGALVEINRKIGEFVQIGAGYNFTEFNDDLTHLDYTSQGPFIRLTAMLYDRTPEEIERALQRVQEEKINQWTWELVNEELANPNSSIMLKLNSYYNTAKKLQDEGKTKDAKELYERIQMTTDMMYNEAEKYIRRRLELEKKIKEDNQLALVYYQQGKFKKAKELWEKITKEAKPEPIFIEF